MDQTAITRFWAKVDKGDGTGCWEWTAARLKRPNGTLSYGIFGMNRTSVGAHRVAWELTNGPIPAGKWLLHHCDNQGCVRPDHLYIGDHKDNTRDAVVRRRMEYGERRWNHKLRDVDITAIRALYAAGFPTERIGPIFGVSGGRIRSIIRGEGWRHVA